MYAFSSLHCVLEVWLSCFLDRAKVLPNCNSMWKMQTQMRCDNSATGVEKILKSSWRHYWTFPQQILPSRSGFGRRDDPDVVIKDFKVPDCFDVESARKFNWKWKPLNAITVNVISNLMWSHFKGPIYKRSVIRNNRLFLLWSKEPCPKVITLSVFYLFKRII